MSEVKQVSKIIDIPKKLANSLLDDNERNIDRVLKNFKYLKEAAVRQPRFLKNVNHQTNERNINLSPTKQSKTDELLILNMDSTLLLPYILTNDQQQVSLFQKNVINYQVFSNLQHSEKLNWWLKKGFSTKLYPLLTNNQQHSLLESISIALYGCEDQTGQICQLIKDIFKEEHLTKLIFNQWKHVNYNCFQMDINTWKQLIIDSIDNLLDVGKYTRLRNLTFNVEAIFLYMISHVIKRPVFVLCEKANTSYIINNTSNESTTDIQSVIITNGLCQTTDPSSEHLSSANYSIEGWYLPLNLDNANCRKYPLLLAYSYEKYFPLVPMEENCFLIDSLLKALLPIVDKDNQFYNIHFVNASNHIRGSNDYSNKLQSLKILKDYLNIKYVSMINQNKENGTEMSPHAIIEGMVWNNGSDQISEESSSSKAQNLRRKVGKSLSNLRRSLFFLINQSEEPIAKNNDLISSANLDDQVPCMHCCFSRMKEFDRRLLSRLEIAAALADNFPSHGNENELHEMHHQTISNSTSIDAMNCSDQLASSSMNAENYNNYNYNDFNYECSNCSSTVVNSEYSNNFDAKSSRVFSIASDAFSQQSDTVAKCSIKNVELKRLQFTQSKSEDAGHHAPVSIPFTHSHDDNIRHQCFLNNSPSNMGVKSLENIKSLDSHKCKLHNDLTRFDLRYYMSEEMIKVVGSEASVIGSNVFEKGTEFSVGNIANENFIEKNTDKYFSQ